MANVIKLKKSIVAGNIPTTSNLALGEGAVNHTDQKIYFRHPGTGVVWNFAGGSGGGGTKTYAVFTVRDNQPPATNFATLDTRNSIAVLDFDAATDESAIFLGIMPEAASLASGLKIRLIWTASTATASSSASESAVSPESSSSTSSGVEPFRSRRTISESFTKSGRKEFNVTTNRNEN